MPRALLSMFRHLPALLLLLTLAGCATTTNIVIGGNYPVPLARKLPLAIGVYYPPQLRNHSYTEVADESEGKDKYVVQSGAAQVKLFNTVLPSMFKSVVMLDSPEQAATQAGIDAVLIPTLTDFQLGLPQKTRLKSYEIWLKYDIRLTKPGGERIADWAMTAYGKSPEEEKGVVTGIKSAGTVAMRDLAANFTLGFAKVPDVKDWLQSRQRP
ncbi:MAG TPA: hypothetical protein VMH83_07140 [Candidatus Acidoferrum sp.]|nr:hypothetical protein [Candidatus Acidoferrum sp.]